MDSLDDHPTLAQNEDAETDEDRNEEEKRFTFPNDEEEDDNE
jgi:hypothetical protein